MLMLPPWSRIISLIMSTISDLQISNLLIALSFLILNLNKKMK